MDPHRRSRRLSRPRGLQPARRSIRSAVGGQRERRVPARRRRLRAGRCPIDQRAGLRGRQLGSHVGHRRRRHPPPPRLAHQRHLRSGHSPADQFLEAAARSAGPHLGGGPRWRSAPPGPRRPAGRHGPAFRLRASDDRLDAVPLRGPRGQHLGGSARRPAASVRSDVPVGRAARRSDPGRRAHDGGLRRRLGVDCHQPQRQPLHRRPADDVHAPAGAQPAQRSTRRDVGFHAGRAVAVQRRTVPPAAGSGVDQLGSCSRPDDVEYRDLLAVQFPDRSYDLGRPTAILA